MKKWLRLSLDVRSRKEGIDLSQKPKKSDRIATIKKCPKVNLKFGQVCPQDFFAHGS
jgi:hypothetical protein